MRYFRLTNLSETFAIVAFFLTYYLIGDVDSNECMHEECIEYANLLNASIDVGIHPCKNFVAFVCGKTCKNCNANNATPKTNNVTIPTTFTNYMEKVREVLKEQLGQPYLKNSEPRSVGLAKAYWQNCKVIKTAEAIEGVKLLFKRLGEWPVTVDDWDGRHFSWHVFSKCARALGFLPRMFLHVGLNYGNTEEQVLMNDTLQLTVERQKYMFTRDDVSKKMKRFKEYVRVAQLLTKKGKVPYYGEIELALNFGKILHKLGQAEHGQPVVNLTEMSIALLQKQYPIVNWLEYLRSILTKKQADYISDRTCIFVETNYIEQVDAILRVTPRRVQANYAFLSIIDDLHLLVRPHLSVAVAKKRSEKENICFDSTAAIFGKSLDLIVRRMVGLKKKQKVDEIQKRIVEVAHRLFYQIPWMDNPTRMHAARKLERMTFINGFLNDNSNDRHFDRLALSQPMAILVLFREINTFLVDQYYLQAGKPRDAYVIYSKTNETIESIMKSSFSARDVLIRPERTRNEIYIPGGALLFNRFSPVPEMEFMSYGMIGLQIAAAIGHQIYQKGAYFDYNNEQYDYSWWTLTTYSQFLDLKGCHAVGPTKPLTEMSSIFAYIGGAEISYKAMFERHQSEIHNVTLPGLPYTTRQLFWISTVALDCDPQLMHRYNTMVAHNPKFAADFNCPSNSKMSAKNKCKMWIS